MSNLKYQMSNLRSHMAMLIRAGLLGLVLLSLTAGVALAQDAQTYTVKITQVDTTRFPEITVWVQVTDAAGNPVSTVPDSDFTLLEAGQPVDHGSFQAGEQSCLDRAVIDRAAASRPGQACRGKAAAKTFVELMRPEDGRVIAQYKSTVSRSPAIKRL
jgi:hypothetical protein